MSHRYAFIANASPDKAREATAFLMKHNMLERTDVVAEVRSEPTHVALTHAYLAEEYNFEDGSLITDNAGYYS